MSNIGFCAIAFYRWRIYLRNANVVQQGGLFDKSFVGIPFRMPTNNFYSFICYRPTMNKQYMALLFTRAILVDDIKRIHTSLFN